MYNGYTMPIGIVIMPTSFSTPPTTGALQKLGEAEHRAEGFLFQRRLKKVFFTAGSKTVNLLMSSYGPLQRTSLRR